MARNPTAVAGCIEFDRLRRQGGITGMSHRRQLLGGALAWVVVILRRTCRYEIFDDPRPALRAAGRPYIIALLHAHQAGALMGSDEPKLAAMVSRSRDGDLLVPALRTTGVEAVRGSARSRARGKGGLEALERLGEWLAEGVPVLLAVDGPRGPRGHVHLGVAELARRSHAPVVALVVVPSRRWCVPGSWDRFQLPLPFAKIRGYFGTPQQPAPGESLGEFRARVQCELEGLEKHRDPEEAGRNASRR